MVIFLYTFSLMYSPSSLNFRCLEISSKEQFKKSIQFFLGIFSGFFFLLMFFGYLSQIFIPTSWHHYLNFLGVIYTFYIAIRGMLADITNKQSRIQMTFNSGLISQLTNPKTLLVTLPVSVIIYPILQITGGMIFIVSLLISLLSVGAPVLYAIIGNHNHTSIFKNTIIFEYLNIIMGVILIISGTILLRFFLKSIHTI